jgi:hypothetical protein
VSVYVDSSRYPYGRMVMCHMFADTPAELDEMAMKIGIKFRWKQKIGTNREHYDICKAKRRLAIIHGAKEVTSKELGQIMLRKRAEREQSGGERCR